MSKCLIAISLFIFLITACVQQYATPTDAAEIPFAQSLATTTSTALFSLVEPIPTSTPLIVAATAAISCAAPTPHVKAEQQVTVVVEDWDKLKLRSDPKISPDNVILELNMYTQLLILYGPVCVTDKDTGTEYLFWNVVVISSGERGWVAEGNTQHYFIEPIVPP